MRTIAFCRGLQLIFKMISPTNIFDLK
jgi:hypothetical protein